LVQQLRDALAFHSQPVGERALMLVNALHDRIERLEARLEPHHKKPKKRAA
jgi:hypothetical protein